MFHGTAIHDTSQVTGAALMYAEQVNEPAALHAAVVTKLVRNLCIAAVIPIMAFLYHRSRMDHVKGDTQKWHQVVPLFVIAFVLLAALNSIAELGEKPYGLIERETWSTFQDHVIVVSGWCLTIAMTAVGLGTSLSKLKGLDLKPLCVSFFASVLVGLVSIGMIKVLVEMTE